ncbi:transposase [Nitrosomonas ureae]|uniref:transposase n=1 Tax=Nitrosomonas ureae TaxID=44577 RepID=UPI002FF71A5F
MYHFVWIPKYRHKAFMEPYRSELKGIIGKIGYDYDIVELPPLNGHIMFCLKEKKYDTKLQTCLPT